jgi:Protein of unknown function (DUF2630)
MSDETIAARIERLVAEEHELRSLEQADSADPGALEDEKDRLRAVEVELDRCWDLLRQRRALREAGADPEGATARDADTVERYLQ